MGKKRQPIYKVVAADVRSPRDGKIIESIGLYNPKTNPATIEVNVERALYWLSVGAQPTTTVKNILSSEGILLKNELLKKGIASEEADLQVTAWKEGKAKKPVKKVEKLSKEKVVEVEPKVTESVSEVKGTASEESVSEEEVKEES
jgi:small subunit ribosomal protein S16